VSPYGLDNLPYGVFGPGDGTRRIGVRLGDEVLDLSGRGGVLARPTLNPLMALGPAAWAALRSEVIGLASAGRLPALPLADVSLHLPFEVADYVDFYSAEAHAANLGRILRPDGPAVLPNWRHLPVGYHGRAGTVVVSGTPVRRPYGQLGPGEFGATRRLDIEAEVGFVVGVGGARLRTTDLAAHVFGVVLVNDWSARDIQAWEYQPLGPFLGKSFATSVSPWVVPLDALAPLPAPEQDPVPLDYLLPAGSGFDIRLVVELNGTRISAPPYAAVYWTPAQQLAHLTVNGATVRTGDLYASGTVSGPGRDEVGSLVELTRGGTEPVPLADGSTRTYLADGDTVTISGTAPGSHGGVVGLGAVTGTVVPGV
jgi:fumarylacetoacetase